MHNLDVLVYLESFHIEVINFLDYLFVDFLLLSRNLNVLLVISIHSTGRSHFILPSSTSIVCNRSSLFAIS